MTKSNGQHGMTQQRARVGTVWGMRGGGRPAAWTTVLGCVTVAVGLGCGDKEKPPGGDDLIEEVPVCYGSYGSPMEVSTTGESRLVEVSGMAASRTNPGVLWLHNDSGSYGELFAIREDGVALGRVTVMDIRPRDPEDIAVGLCPIPVAQCLWLADTGNNNFDRTDQAVYAIAEPNTGLESFGTLTADQIWYFPVAFPDPINAEAIVVTPDGSAMYFFEKSDGPRARVFVYEAPFVPDERVTVEYLTTIDSPAREIVAHRQITGADLHPSGSRLAMRAYAGVYEYRLADNSLERLDLAQLIQVASGPASEPQGESVAYASSGVDLWTISEDPNARVAQPLHFYGCIK